MGKTTTGGFEVGKLYVVLSGRFGLPELTVFDSDRCRAVRLKPGVIVQCIGTTTNTALQSCPVFIVPREHGLYSWGADPRHLYFLSEAEWRARWP